MEGGHQFTRVVTAICESLDGGVSHYRSWGSWHLKVYPEILLVVNLTESWKRTETTCDNTTASLFPTITYSTLTPRSTVLLEKLTGFQLIKKFPAFYGT